jgi:hypothetical protein
MSLKDSIELSPGDIRKFVTKEVNSDADRQLSAGCGYIRIVKIIETDKFTAEIEAHPHVNGYYDDTALTFGSKIDSSLLIENPLEYPVNVTPLDAVETLTYAKDGTALSVVRVEVTYPE